MLEESEWKDDGCGQMVVRVLDKWRDIVMS